MKIRIWNNKPDKAKDRIKVETITLDRFNQNPVLLYFHDASSQWLPIGTVKNLRIEKDELVGDMEFDVQDPFAAMIAGKYERGIMKGISPRFFAYGPKEIEAGITDYDYAELVEISCVTLPSHMDAVVLAKNLEAAPDGAVDLRKNVFIENLTINKTNQMKDLKKALGLNEDATEAVVIEKYTDLTKRLSISEAALKLKETEAADLQKKFDTLVQETKGKQIDLMVDTAVNEKKITPAEAAEFKELAKMEGGLERVSKILTGKAPAVASITSAFAQGGDKKLDDLKKALKADFGYMDYFEKAPKTLELIKELMPEHYKELLDGIKK